MNDMKKINISAFDQEVDRAILFGIYQYGYGNWNLILNFILNNTRFELAWITKSLTSSEIQRRVDYLVELLEREERIGAAKKN